jgi:hypothetical protein
MPPKTVLIFCSNQNRRDFPRPKNQQLLRKEFGDNYIPIFCEWYPEDVPREGRYDGVLFAGCNRLDAIFHNDYLLGMATLWSGLKRGGKVFFVEGNNYINHVRHSPYSIIHPNLTISLEEMMIVHENEHPLLRGQILDAWGQLFKFHHRRGRRQTFFYKKIY